MNKFRSALALSLVALSAGAFAQDVDSSVARQQRMDAAYANSHDTRVADSGVRQDAREAGHAVHGAVRATGHAVHSGLRATGHAIHRGVRATGHAIHRGVNKITGN